MEIKANNKRASFDYFLQDKILAGIVLQGCEVKSVREGGVSLADTFVKIENGEAWLKNAYIKPYEKTSSFKPNERKDRKLLLTKQQIVKLEKFTKDIGNSIVATKIGLEHNLVKVEIATAIGKKLYDKRETLKKKSAQKEIDCAVKFSSKQS